MNRYAIESQIYSGGDCSLDRACISSLILRRFDRSRCQLIRLSTNQRFHYMLRRNHLLVFDQYFTLNRSTMIFEKYIIPKYWAS